jgi:hypothetical protein
MSKIYPRRPSRWDMVSLSIMSCPLGWPMHRHISCTSWTQFPCRSWTSSLWCSLITFWYIRGVWKNMKITSELYFNIYETISCMPSLASASSRSRKYHSWVMWFHLKESRWTPARWKRSWIRSHQLLCLRCRVSLGWPANIEGSFQTSPRLQSQLLGCWRKETSTFGVMLVMKHSSI